MKRQGIRVRLELAGYATERTACALTRLMPAVPRVGERVHVFELGDRGKHGVIGPVAREAPRDWYVELVWWGPFPDDELGNVDVLLRLVDKPRARA